VKEASRSPCGGNEMINGPGLLQDIVVRIYSDADLKTSMGTGFFLKDD